MCQVNGRFCKYYINKGISLLLIIGLHYFNNYIKG